MHKFLLIAIACVLGVSACSRLREPTDAQLGALLRSERANPADANASLDGPAIECLRAWSGDTQLLKDLPMRSAGEEGRKACREKMDGWIGDTSRNPDKFTFADVSAPKTVRRAMDLAEARLQGAMMARRQAPPAPGKPLTDPVFHTPNVSVDLGAAGPVIQEAENLCQQANQAAALGKADPRLVSYAKYCGDNLRKMRGSMERFAQNKNAKGLEALTTTATNMANSARDVLALPPQK